MATMKTLLVSAVVILGLMSTSVVLSAHHSWPVSYEKLVTGSGDFMAQALQRVTKSVPIVVSGSFDPVGSGLWRTSRIQAGTSRGSSNT